MTPLVRPSGNIYHIEGDPPGEQSARIRSHVFHAAVGGVLVNYGFNKKPSPPGGVLWEGPDPKMVPALIATLKPEMTVGIDGIEEVLEGGPEGQGILNSIVKAAALAGVSLIFTWNTPLPEPTTYVERVRRLPDGTRSRVISAAHEIADAKRTKHVGPGAINAGEFILYYDEDTWEQALNAQAPEAVSSLTV